LVVSGALSDTYPSFVSGDISPRFLFRSAIAICSAFSMATKCVHFFRRQPHRSSVWMLISGLIALVCLQQLSYSSFSLSPRTRALLECCSGLDSRLDFTLREASAANVRLGDHLGQLDSSPLRLGEGRCRSRSERRATKQTTLRHEGQGPVSGVRNGTAQIGRWWHRRAVKR